MKIASRISKSRHGIYYYRLQFSIAGQRREHRLSLSTKNPIIAKEKSLLLSAALLAERKGIRMATDDDLNIQQIIEKLKRSAHELKIVMRSPCGTEFVGEADPDNPADLAALLQAGKDFRESDLGKSFGLNDKPEPIVAPTPIPASGGMTIDEAIKKYATREQAKLAKSTAYEYGNYHEKFKNWVHQRYKTATYPIGKVSRQDMSDYIDELLTEGLAHKTIKDKYLAAISALFRLAQAQGSYPESQKLPSHGHNLWSKRDAKKAHAGSSWKPFTADELKRIFAPDTFLKQKRPADYWLPLLGLFFGGRINELCQIMPATDVRQIDGVWSIAITDEGDGQQLKSLAARRTVPIHPQLIELGFLDFVEDMKPYGGILFPYLTEDPNKGGFGATPSERWGKYLDSIGITDSRKVFHSFRSTANDRLKQQGISEETRCQFVGHEHGSINSKTYSQPHSVGYLLEHVAPKLDFDLSFDQIIAPREALAKMTANLMMIKRRRERHKNAKEKREQTTS